MEPEWNNPPPLDDSLVLGLRKIDMDDYVNHLHNTIESLKLEIKTQREEIASPFEQILLGTIALHELARHGKNDSDEADAIRDSLDEPWRNLTESERETTRAVSAALQRYNVPGRCIDW